MSTGRYMVIDHKTGRKFIIEPISERDQRLQEQTTLQGGAMLVKGGAIRREDSILDGEDVVEVNNPMDHITKELEEDGA